MAIKGQAMADFIEEFTIPNVNVIDTGMEAIPLTLPALPLLKDTEPDRGESRWTLFMDESSNSKCTGAGIVLVVPDSTTIQYTIRLSFKASNNEAEYEALLAGLRPVNIICRFGVSHTIISDNRKQFDNDRFKGMFRGLDISNAYSLPHHPQSNGQVEAVNKVIKHHLKMKLEKAKGKWLDELPFVLWAYRTTTQSFIGGTPFSLSYGWEAILPVKIGLPAARVRNYQED
ncbi:uncharacterized protein LOC131234606 [Magnolia sinica]|uniref:uncharacterized protein LOC131234606 n=1 Tax=Magnolia sinica TaxID=86752 RepID=UPI00265AC555|nr:uncharacterized protein LOC131234606 [Magnolia sinica]